MGNVRQKQPAPGSQTSTARAPQQTPVQEPPSAITPAPVAASQPPRAPRSNQAMQALLSAPRPAAQSAATHTSAQPRPAPNAPVALPVANRGTTGTERAAQPVQRPGPNASEPGRSRPPPSRPQPTQAGAQRSGPLVAEDGAAELDRGQLHRSTFLTRLRSALTTAVAAGPESAAPQSQRWIDAWVSHCEQRSAMEIERALHGYAPETAGATTAEESIRMLQSRIRQGAAAWHAAGPSASAMPGISMPFMHGAAGEVPSRAPRGGVLFKPRAGAQPAPAEPRELRKQLGRGRALDLSVRTRMESIFQTDLSSVRLHTDSKAASLAERQNARAFTVGKHVAFAAGEFHPGTVPGDALLAHELAHTLQQKRPSADQAETSASMNGALEKDADQSAGTAVAALWLGAKGKLAAAARSAAPALKSGLRLSRCPQTAQAPMKTLTLNMTKLEGSTRSFSVTNASTIWENAARIRISAGTTETLDRPTSEALIGADLVLDEYSAVGSPTTEEVALTARNRSSGRVTAYYVQSLSHGSHGEAFWSSGFPTVPASVVLKNGDSPFVSGKPLAHELGHVLTDVGAHEMADTTNLMSYSNDGVGLNDTQVQAARGSSFVT